MQSFNPIRALAAAALAGGLLAAPAAMAAPSATIHFSGGSVAFIGQVNWGGGTLNYRGKAIPLKITGIGVGAIGADKFDAEGEVYHLHRLGDIEGTYAAVNASATAGTGAGWVDMTNEHGVEIRARSTSAGLKLSLAPTGMGVRLK
jgi:hypothetical protein